MHVCIYVFIYEYIFVCMYVCMHIYVCVYGCARICARHYAKGEMIDGVGWGGGECAYVTVPDTPHACSNFNRG